MFNSCMQRLQANLAYLAALHERSTKPMQNMPPGPVIMDPPLSGQPWADLYGRLQVLFPGWRGQKMKPVAAGTASSPT